MKHSIIHRLELPEVRLKGRAFVRAVSATLATSLGAWVSLAHATVVQEHSLKEVAEHAEAVFVGRVDSKKSDIDPKTGLVWTLYTFSVERTLAGEIPGNTTSLRCLGGTVGDRSMRSEGLPLLATGERLVVFADVDGHPLCQFSGWELGVFHFRKTNNGKDVIVNRHGHAVVGIGTDNPVATPATLEAVPGSGKISVPHRADTEEPGRVSGTGVTPDAPQKTEERALVGVDAVLDDFQDFVSAYAIHATKLTPTVDVVGPSPQAAKR